MAIFQSTLIVKYLGLLVSFTLLVRGGDPSQQHPITASNPPRCASLPHSTDTCSLTSSSISQCTYSHCHIQLPTGCTDWWQVLNLTCLCGALGTSACTQTCRRDVPRTFYLNWLWSTCTVIPGWKGLPSGTDLQIPNTAQLLATDLKILRPSCIAAQDGQAFDACSMNTFEVASLPMSANFSLDKSEPYQLDRNCFCGQFSFENTMNRSTCASGTIGYSQALVWLNFYCGNYDNFQQEQMPPDWKNTLLLKNDTYTVTSDLQSLWNSSGANSCESGFNNLVSQCGNRTRCPSVNDCNNPIVTVDIECFWSNFPTHQARLLDWCAGNRIASVKAILWYEKNNVNSTRGLPAAQLLPWAVPIHPSNFTLNDDTNLLVNGSRACPSAGEKLGSFAAVNVIIAILVPILGRRTVINKITCGYFGQSKSRSWPFTGLIGVVLHLGSNAVNAQIIKNTPGFEGVSISHLVFLWCTRPRLAWLVVACVPFQSGKAMYFSVTASTLITEFILQIFGMAYMGIATNYGRLSSFYDASTLRDYGGIRGHDARIMYAGCLLWWTVFPFALTACAWSVFGISTHVRTLSTYLVGMEALARKQDRIASANIGYLIELMSVQAFRLDEHQEETVHHHCQYLQTQSDSLVQKWRSLQASSVPISQELRRDRKERVREVRMREADKRWSPAQERFDSPWFLDPPRRANENHSHATSASANANSHKAQRSTLWAQIKRSEHSLSALKQDQKILEQQIDELEAVANILVTQNTRQTFHLGSLGYNQRRPSDWSAVNQSSPEDQRRLRIAKQSHNNNKFEIQNLLRIMQHQVNLDVIYEQLGESWDSLAASHRNMADGWKKVEDERRAEAKAELRPKKFIGIPMVVLSGMLVTWTAQWLWWVGYVRVAQDSYCPPKLVALTTVWTVFSASGATIGASF